MKQAKSYLEILKLGRPERAPLYRQIYERFRTAIEQGVLRPGEERQAKSKATLGSGKGIRAISRHRSARRRRGLSAGAQAACRHFRRARRLGRGHRAARAPVHASARRIGFEHGAVVAQQREGEQQFLE